MTLIFLIDFIKSRFFSHNGENNAHYFSHSVTKNPIVKISNSICLCIIVKHDLKRTSQTYFPNVLPKFLELGFGNMFFGGRKKHRNRWLQNVWNYLLELRFGTPFWNYLLASFKIHSFYGTISKINFLFIRVDF